MNIKHYTDKEGNLYHRNLETGTIKQTNCKQWKFFTFEDLNSIDGIKQIKKNKYNELLNTYFRKLKMKWTFQGTEYKKLGNFELNEWGIISNYNVWNYDTCGKPKDDVELPIVPYVKIDESEKFPTYGIFIIFRGRVGYISHYVNGGWRFYDIHKKEFTQWVTIKNCAPIMNCTTKQIVGKIN